MAQVIKHYKRLYYLDNTTDLRIISYFGINTTEKDHYLEEDTAAAHGSCSAGSTYSRLRAWGGWFVERGVEGQELWGPPYCELCMSLMTMPSHIN